MSKTTGLSLEELKAKRSALKASGKSLSTSKEMGKVEDAIKVLQPNKYDAGQVASAQKKLASSTQLPSSANNPYSTSSPSDVSSLEAQLKSKQDALIKATSNINDNPWYSEATRVGKLGKLNNIAQLEISNLNTQLAQKKQDIENAKPKTQVVTSTDDQGNLTISTINSETGQIIKTNSLAGAGKATKTPAGGGSKTTNTNKYLTSATNYLKEADIAFTGKGTEDKLLSREEQVVAYNKILALVGGDATLAQQVFQQAWDTGGYGNYGQ
jgi:hypothetical protein